jgi:hypothetical protein
MNKLEIKPRIHLLRTSSGDEGSPPLRRTGHETSRRPARRDDTSSSPFAVPERPPHWVTPCRVRHGHARPEPIRIPHPPAFAIQTLFSEKI